VNLLLWRRDDVDPRDGGPVSGSDCGFRYMMTTWRERLAIKRSRLTTVMSLLPCLTVQVCLSASDYLTCDRIDKLSWSESCIDNCIAIPSCNIAAHGHIHTRLPDLVSSTPRTAAKADHVRLSLCPTTVSVKPKHPSSTHHSINTIGRVCCQSISKSPMHRVVQSRGLKNEIGSGS